MIEDDDLLGGDGETGDGDSPGEETVAAEPEHGAAALTGGTCLSCGAASIGVFCANCGQKNDDLRRSIFLLGRDFIEDTFAFDSRMWRTLGVLAIAPGAVATNYAHGKRSRYTPPVRLFLVVSFLFFLEIALTQTLFLGVELTPRTPEQIAETQAKRAKVMDSLPEDGRVTPVDDGFEVGLGDGDVIEIAGDEIDCNVNFKLHFFIKQKDLNIDQAAWRRCADSIGAAAAKGMASNESVGGENTKATQQFEQIMAGVTGAIEDPVDFNNEINAWLPRVMFFMAPLAALLMGIFIRGRDALFFDHMVMSLYSHAVAFSLAGTAIALTQFGLPYAGLGAAIALFIYSVGSLRRAYGRGWVKTVYSTLMVGAFYSLILLSIVVFIVIRIVLKG